MEVRCHHGKGLYLDISTQSGPRSVRSLGSPGRRQSVWIRQLLPNHRHCESIFGADEM